MSKLKSALVASTLVLSMPLFVLQAQAVNLKGLLGKEILISVGAEVLFQAALAVIKGDFPGITEDTDLTTEYFDSLGLETVVISGAYAFYTSPAGVLRDNNEQANKQVSNVEADLTSTSKAMINGVSDLGARYTSIVNDAEGKTVNGFFDDQVFATVDPATLLTGDPFLTGETLYGGGYSFAYLGGVGDGEFAATELALTSLKLKKCTPLDGKTSAQVDPQLSCPIPEPSANISLLALGILGSSGLLLNFKKRQTLS